MTQPTQFRTTQANQPSISSRPSPDSDILRRVDERCQNIFNYAASHLTGEATSQAAPRVARHLTSGAGRALNGANTLYGILDDPVGALIVASLNCVGINGTTYYAAACLILHSDSIGLDPHEQLDVTKGKYQLMAWLWKHDQEYQRLKAWPARTEQERAGIETQKRAVEAKMRDVLEQLRTNPWNLRLP